MTFKRTFIVSNLTAFGLRILYGFSDACELRPRCFQIDQRLLFGFEIYHQLKKGASAIRSLIWLDVPKPDFCEGHTGALVCNDDDLMWHPLWGAERIAFLFSLRRVGLEQPNRISSAMLANLNAGSPSFRRCQMSGLNCPKTR